MEIKKITALPKGKSLIGVGAGLLAAIVITLILAGALAAFLAYTPLSEGKIHSFGILCTIIALFCGGLVTSGLVGKKGLYHGLALGICFIAIVWIYTAFCGDVAAGALIIKACYILLAAAAGGILGIRSKN